MSGPANISSAEGLSCTGCAACFAVCPVDAINYGLNVDGFLEGRAKEDKCIRCGRCVQVCSKFSEFPRIGRDIGDCRLFAARSTDTGILKRSTSGGIAAEFARHLCANGWWCAGAVYDPTEKRAKTIMAQTPGETKRFAGSKYLQSDCGETVKEIYGSVCSDPDAKVAFFGTPCQIAGLRAMEQIGKWQGKILLIELFCHGVPSQLLWNEYSRNLPDLCYVRFRDKKYGAGKYTLAFESNGYTRYKKPGTDLFYRAYFDKIFLMRHCFSCGYRRGNSLADIRLGDFWAPQYRKDNEGVSAVSVVTGEGKNLLERLVSQGRITILAEHSPGDVAGENFRKEYPHVGLRDTAVKMLQEGVPARRIIKYCERNTLSARKRVARLIKRGLSYF